MTICIYPTVSGIEELDYEIHFKFAENNATVRV